jgi:FkbM family methyltransferase
VRSRLSPGDIVVDIGAHVGWYTLIACKAVGPNGKVYAFEPDPKNFSFLKKNIALNGCTNVVAEQKAVSDQGGTLELFLHKDHSGWNKIRYLGDTTSSVSVEAVSFDDYFKDRAESIDFVKIDVEGAEGLILKGMKDSLEKFPTLELFIEYHPHLWKSFGFNPEEVVQNLANQGFSKWFFDEKKNQYGILDDVTWKYLSSRLFTEMEYANLLLKRGKSTPTSLNTF